jgi:uridine phosphorylase
MYPILEHDYKDEAKIEPSKVIKPRDVPEHCVLVIMSDVVEEVVEKKNAEVAVKNWWQDGPHNVYEIEHKGQRLAFTNPGVGGPLAAGLFEEVIAFGSRKFILCGGCGVLEEGLTVGKLIIVTSALRDEGVSYHYLPPAREVTGNPAAIKALHSVLKEEGLPYVTGKTWTTSGPYRETQKAIDARRAEGCITVEMEAASLMAVAQFRNVPLGTLLYAGDDLSGDEWDKRDWHSREDIREGLFWLAADACLQL